MERAIQIFAIVNLTIIGISHVVQPRVWVDFFVFLRERGKAGAFVTAFLSLFFGSIIVAFHNVWSGLPLVLTVFGWLQILKALIYFTVPSFGLRKLHIPSSENAHLFVLPGVLFLVLAGLLGYHVWFKT